jgi:hypothetical protein
MNSNSNDNSKLNLALLCMNVVNWQDAGVLFLHDMEITDLSGYQGEDAGKNTHWLPDEYLVHQKCEEVGDPIMLY